MDYRRGIDRERGELNWQQLWHFNEACPSYPTRDFIVRKDRPPSSELCGVCENGGQATGWETTA
jgi:hypothetical protein